VVVCGVVGVGRGDPRRAPSSLRRHGALLGVAGRAAGQAASPPGPALRVLHVAAAVAARATALPQPAEEEEEEEQEEEENTVSEAPPPDTEEDFYFEKPLATEKKE